VIPFFKTRIRSPDRVGSDKKVSQSRLGTMSLAGSFRIIFSCDSCSPEMDHGAVVRPDQVSLRRSPGGACGVVYEGVAACGSVKKHERTRIPAEGGARAARRSPPTALPATPRPVSRPRWMSIFARPHVDVLACEFNNPTPSYRRLPDLRRSRPRSQFLE
jgi:hypothetical protein